MAIFVMRIVLNVLAVITGLIAIFLGFIGFVDDKDMYVPAAIWLMLMIGAIASSYLLSTAV
ncbi:MAG: hypothetical protein WCJ29_01085 [bacterium]